MTQHVVYGFILKDESTTFKADIAYNNNFESFDYKTKLLKDMLAQSAPNNNNGILKNATTAMPLKFLSNFWSLLEMPLINCKVELKLK